MRHSTGSQPPNWKTPFGGFFRLKITILSYNFFKTLHSQLENNDEVRQPEALFERSEFAKGPVLRKIVFLIDEHSKIAPAIYTCLEKVSNEIILLPTTSYQS
jgi:hypothetical protein